MIVAVSILFVLRGDKEADARGLGVTSKAPALGPGESAPSSEEYGPGYRSSHALLIGIDYGDEMANCEFFQRRPGSPSRYDDSFNRGQDVWFELGRLPKKTKSQEGDGSGITLRVLSHSNFDENRGQ